MLYLRLGAIVLTIEKIVGEAPFFIVLGYFRELVVELKEIVFLYI